MKAWVILGVAILIGAAAIGILGPFIPAEYSDWAIPLLAGLLAGGSAFAAGRIRKHKLKARAAAASPDDVGPTPDHL